MADVFSKQKRSDIMSQVKSRGNAATELRAVRIFRENDITGWRRNTVVFGNPDFVFPKARLAIFVDGCFWHRCPLHGSGPATNRSFWEKKLSRNLSRDGLVNRTLRKRGWRVMRIWQHELRNSVQVARRVSRAISRTPISEMETGSRRSQLQNQRSQTPLNIQKIVEMKPG